MSTFPAKVWKDYDPLTGIGDPSTPMTAAALIDAETRLSDYTWKRASFISLDADFAGAGDGVTNNRTALINAIAAAPAGSTIKLGSGVYYVDVSAGNIAVTKSLKFKGDGVGATKIKVGPENTLSFSGILFRVASIAMVEFEDLTLEGPTTMAANQHMEAVKHVGTEPGAIITDRAQFQLFSYSIFCPGWTGTGTYNVAAANLNARVFCRDTVFIGAAVYPNATRESMGVLHQAAKCRVTLVDCDFSQFGKDADFHNHAVYVGRGTDLLIVGGNIDQIVGGRAIQVEDQIPDYPTVGQYAEQLILGVRIGSQFNTASGGSVGILTSSAVSLTRIWGCVILHPQRSIELRGLIDIQGNTLRTNDASFSPLFTNSTLDSQSFPTPTYHTARGRVRHNTFLGVCLNDIDIASDASVSDELWIEDNHHWAATGDAHVRVRSSSVGAKLYVRRGVGEGTNAAQTAFLWADAGTVVEFDENQVLGPGKGIYTPGLAIGALRFRRNDFSQVGVSVDMPVAPTAVAHGGNYGSKGYKDRAQGTLTIISGDKIITDLGSVGSSAVLPNRFGLTPAVAKRIAAITGIATVSGVELVTNPTLDVNFNGHTAGFDHAVTQDARVTSGWPVGSNASAGYRRTRYTAVDPTEFGAIYSEFGATASVVVAGHLYRFSLRIADTTNSSHGYKLLARFWTAAGVSLTTVLESSWVTGVGVNSVRFFDVLAPATAARAAVGRNWWLNAGESIDAYSDDFSIQEVATTMTATLHDDTGAAIVAPETVTWWADRVS